MSFLSVEGLVDGSDHFAFGEQVMNVLVVGDKDHERKPVVDTVRSLGHHVCEDGDGTEAWERFCRTHFDVIISDYLMPRMDGFQLCKNIRRSPHPDYTYFIIVSRRGAEQNLLDGFRSGVDDYLAKPVSPVELECRLLSAKRVTEMHRRLAETNNKLMILSKELRTESRKDPLTGIGNRLSFQDDLQRFLDQHKRYKHQFYLGLCDIDNFKKFNDTYGHLEGDRVLKSVAKTLVQESRSSDFCYRFGGEEFLLVLAEQDDKGSQVAAERLRKAVEDLNIVHEQNPPFKKVTLSIGLAPFTASEASEVDGCLKKADTALYWSKDNGRNRVASFHHLPVASNASS